MTIKIICTCDHCCKVLPAQDGSFKISVGMFDTIHFCDMDCMRPYLEAKWTAMDKEKHNLME